MDCGTSIEACTSQLNYATIFGIHSVAAAIVFAIAYAPCVGVFAFKAFRSPTYVFIILALFCSIRVASFVIRAMLAGSNTFGENQSLYIADQVLFGVGFFGLLYSAYTLVLDRQSISKASLTQGLISRITRNRRLFRSVLVAAVVIGVIGATQGVSPSSSQSASNTGHNLRIISAIIFLVLTVLQAYRTLSFTLAEQSATAYTSPNSSILSKHGNWVLLVIAALLLVREGYSVASVTHQILATKEALWYPLLALPELLAVLLYATPGLVPPRSQLLERSIQQNVELSRYNTHTYGP